MSRFLDRVMNRADALEGGGPMEATGGFPLGMISDRHFAELQRADAESAREAREWDAQHEPVHPAVLERAALAYREAIAAQQAEEIRRGNKVARDEAIKRDERIAAWEDWRQAALASGQRERTVQEVLAAAGGTPMLLPVIPQ